MTKYHTGYHPNKSKIDDERGNVTGQYGLLQDNVERARRLGDKLPTTAMKQRMDEGLDHLDSAINIWKDAVDDKADFTDETAPEHANSVKMAEFAGQEAKGAANTLANVAIDNGSKTAATISSSAKRVDNAVEAVLKHMRSNGKSHDEKDKNDINIKTDDVIEDRGGKWIVNGRAIKDPFYSANYKLKADKDAMDNDSLEKYKGDIIEAIREPGH